MKSPEAIELLRVATVGTVGFVATVRLADVATVVSIAVGLATLFYVLTKTFFLIKHNGRDPK